MTTPTPNTFAGPARFHLALHVADLDASVAFYTEVFDHGPTKLRDDYAKFEAELPSLNLTMEKVDSTRTKGGTLSHMGIQLQNTELLAAQRERLSAKGLIAYEEKDTDCCYARQEKFWLTDPDGNMVEFFVVLGEGTVRPNQGAMSKAGVCCAAPEEAAPAKQESCCPG
ncbi:MAG: ArsI/CadI family heavy metal resistance metalloenzyme [Acidobacteriota bacterium]|nr:ArsI/CadI family heavy metal resistance metalloenzyme [Acidobacteriota bacterium]